MGGEAKVFSLNFSKFKYVVQNVRYDVRYIPIPGAPLGVSKDVCHMFSELEVGGPQFPMLFILNRRFT